MAPKFVLVTSTVRDGNMSFVFGGRGEVHANRESFLAAHGLRWDQCAVMEVEYGEKILTVENPIKNPEEYISCEALITNVKDLALVLLTADCFPIAYHDPVTQAIALAHCGWRPTGYELPAKVVKRMQEEYGCDPHDIVVHIGPGIHKESYVVEEVLQKEDSRWQPYLEAAGDGNTRVDLVGFIKAQLVGAGVIPDHIFDSDTDTVSNPHYFSHYHATRTGEPEGRFATIVALLG
jgi:polyphenol oxidase